MDKIFDVYIARKDAIRNDRSTVLSLPASPYRMLDALEKIRAVRNDEIYVQIEDCHGFGFLPPMIDQRCGFYELNALAEKLSTLDEPQRAAYQGMARMEAAKRDGSLPFSLLMDLAHSTDICHVVDAWTDAELGRFYADNDFVPEIESIPDAVYELLDFQQIGRKMRETEDGIFTEDGYVVRVGELTHVSEPLPDSPPRPDYIFRLTLDNFPFDEENRQQCKVSLDLPATEEELNAALNKLDAPSWEEVVITDYDGPIPDLEYTAECFDDIHLLNELAKAVEKVMAANELAKFKAILAAEDCNNLSRMISLAGAVDEYILEPQISSPEDLAREELGVVMCSQDMEILLPYVDLAGYGRALLEREQAVITQYGLLDRDRSQAMDMEQSSAPEGMVMM